MKEALKLALEALEGMQNAVYNISGEHVIDLNYAIEQADVAEQAITAIKTALAQPIIQNYLEKDNLQQEPVAWGIIASNTGRICQVELDADEVEGHNPKHIVPLYTTPPQQEAVAWMDIDEKGSASGLRYWSEPDNRHEVALYILKENT